MDNKGGSNETLPVEPIRGEQVNFGAIEQFPVSTELGEIKTPRASEQPQAIGTMPPELPQPENESDVVKNTIPEVGRNAEQISKQYASHVISIVKKNSKDPHELQAQVDELKRQYLANAFGRTLGEAA
ncbi:MAG: hypothetical protein LBT19_01495 [Candidatus Nomurabacteria bacterium]|jgi:hypothetical protein|nr:hypothetical protein [Candidatus Nomurabacteria bacterium]